MTGNRHQARLVEFEFGIDLGAHESTRLAAVLAALAEQPGWDPGRVLADEAQAHRMLYSDLDDDQRATLRLRTDAGVLDARR